MLINGMTEADMVSANGLEPRIRAHQDWREAAAASAALHG